MNKLSKLLLTTSCLTALTAAPAAAVPETEPNNTLGAANNLAVGTTVITGGMTFPSDSDFFRLTGLQPAAAFDVTGTFSFLCAGCSASLLAQNSAGAVIDAEGPFLPGGPAVHVTGTIPDNGILILNAAASVSEGNISYRLDVAAPLQQVPEPSVLSLLASGAAAIGLGALRGLGRTRRTS